MIETELRTMATTVMATAWSRNLEDLSCLMQNSWTPVKKKSKENPPSTVWHSHHTEKETAWGEIKTSLHSSVRGEREGGEDADVEEEVGDKEEQEGAEVSSSFGFSSWAGLCRISQPFSCWMLHTLSRRATWRRRRDAFVAAPIWPRPVAWHLVEEGKPSGRGDKASQAEQGGSQA